MPFAYDELVRLLALGLFAGVVGGLVGLGGSIIIIPVLTLSMHRDQHLAQAAGMLVNIFVAAPAAMRHHVAEAIRWDVMLRMLPFGVVFILVGVELSNQVDGAMLQKLFGGFLVYVILFKLLKRYRDRHLRARPCARVGWVPAGVAGGVMGFFAGLLGIGGGPLAVPMLQRICALPLREGIATSSAVISVTSVVGAARKNAALEHLTDAAGVPLGLHFSDSLWIAACLAPTATLGALFGAGLTHRLPLTWVRVAFLVFLGWAAAQMLGIL